MVVTLAAAKQGAVILVIEANPKKVKKYVIIGNVQNNLQKKQIIRNNNSKTTWETLEFTYKCTHDQQMVLSHYNVAGMRITDGLKL